MKLWKWSRERFSRLFHRVLITFSRSFVVSWLVSRFLLQARFSLATKAICWKRDQMAESVKSSFTCDLTKRQNQNLFSHPIKLGTCWGNDDAVSPLETLLKFLCKSQVRKSLKITISSARYQLFNICPTLQQSSVPRSFLPHFVDNFYVITENENHW